MLLIIIALMLLYRYDDIMKMRPNGIHQWRQSDCLSLTLNYYNENNSLFKPEMHNQIGDGGKSGFTGGEFPILYFVVGKIWRLLGYHEFIYRLILILSSLIALILLFNLLNDILQSFSWSLFITVLLFTSPIYVYYTNNFLTDLPALNLCIMGWYFSYKYFIKNQNILYYIISLMLFLLAGLLKITSLISLAAFLCIFIMDISSIGNLNLDLKKHYKKIIWGVLFIFAGVAFWFYYAKLFNEQHGAKYTFNSIYPIWGADKNEMTHIFHDFRKFTIIQFLNISSLYLFFISIVFLIFKRKFHPFFYFMTICLLAGTIIYLILWYRLIGNHDYYLINLLIVPLFVFTGVLYVLKNNYYNLFSSFKLKIFLFFFLLYNIFAAYNNISMRYWRLAENLKISQLHLTSTSFEIGCWKYGKDHNDYLPFETISDFNKKIGIHKNDKVICIPDNSINITLALMNQKGWVTYGNEFNDTSIFNKRINQGAKYLFIRDSSLYKNDYLKPYIGKKIGTYMNVDIYDLRK